VPLAIVGELEPSGKAGLFRLFKVVGASVSVSPVVGGLGWLVGGIADDNDGRKDGSSVVAAIMVGTSDGTLVGSADGSKVSKGGDWKMLGTSDGASVGLAVGIALLGFKVGVVVVAMVGSSDGKLVGAVVGAEE